MQQDEEQKKVGVTSEAAYWYHNKPIPGKYEIVPSKEMTTREHLSLGYTPGVIFACQEIIKNPDEAYNYTNKSNTVCVISNGTAVLGLGNLGALASKPVMEGKAVLMKNFGDVDCVDLNVNTTDVDELVNSIKLLAAPYGGINLEDIKGPDCFYVEKRLKEIMNIPVFHDDQHGTAVICLAGLINACILTGRKIEDVKVVVNGAGAAGIACLNLMVLHGVWREHCFMCDTKGVIYKGRTDGMNEFKEHFANDTPKRSLQDALEGADVFIGVSVKDALKPEYLLKMNEKPIIFAMANPDPEIKVELAKATRPDCIIATGWSDYPNQVNNVMCFPFLFWGTLDVRAWEINDQMKLAAAYALSNLAWLPVPPEVLTATGREKIEFGFDYIVPTPFDPWLLVTVSTAVAKAAVESGVARLKYKDWGVYEKILQERVDKKKQAVSKMSRQESRL